MITRLVAATVFMISVGNLAHAENLTADNPESIAAAIRDMGYRAEMTTDSKGKPKIASSAEGVNFSIYFYGCDEKNLGCDSIQLQAGFDFNKGLPDSVATDWNSRKRYAKAAMTKDGDPIIRFDVNLDKDGVSRSNFEDTFKIWSLLLVQFKQHIGWKG